MIKIVWLFLITASPSLFAQPCTDEAMAGKTGKWKKGPQGSIRNIAPAELAKEKTFLLNLQKKISAAYTPAGLEVSYSTVWNKDQQPGYAGDPYHLAMYLLRYLCDDSPQGFYVEYSSATNVVVAINQLFSLENMNAAPLPSDHFRGYLRLFRKPLKKDGAFFMGIEKTDNGRIWEESWLITYGDSLPFRYLTRKDYLDLTKSKLEKKISAGETSLQTYLNRVNEELKRPEQELRGIAICHWNEEERFSGFLNEEDRFAFFPVVPDMTYYKKGLPLSAPQFISVNFKYSIGNPVFEKNILALRQVLSFGYLRSLLAK